MPTPPAEDEVLTYLDTLSNWGRWGDDDELGALNLITPEKRRAAAALVREGISVSCSWEIETRPQPDHAFGTPQRYMLATGQGPQRRAPRRRHRRPQRRRPRVHRLHLPRLRHHPYRRALPLLLGREDVQRQARRAGHLRPWRDPSRHYRPQGRHRHPRRPPRCRRRPGPPLARPRRGRPSRAPRGGRGPPERARRAWRRRPPPHRLRPQEG